SSEAENRTRVDAIGAYFLDKNSPTIVQDFQHFLLNHLGFGDFVFLLPKMNQKRSKPTASVETSHNETIEIARASNMQEFEQTLQKIPLESIQFHAN
ncbi:unnamed protein product, partial [marine sediment metagenome]